MKGWQYVLAYALYVLVLFVIYGFMSLPRCSTCILGE